MIQVSRALQLLTRAHAAMRAAFIAIGRYRLLFCRRYMLLELIRETGRWHIAEDLVSLGNGISPLQVY